MKRHAVFGTAGDDKRQLRRVPCKRPVIPRVSDEPLVPAERPTAHKPGPRLRTGALVANDEVDDILADLRGPTMAFESEIVLPDVTKDYLSPALSLDLSGESSVADDDPLPTDTEATAAPPATTEVELPLEQRAVTVAAAPPVVTEVELPLEQRAVTVESVEEAAASRQPSTTTPEQTAPTVEPAKEVPPAAQAMTPNFLNTILALKRKRKLAEMARISMPPTLAERYAPKSMNDVLDNGRAVKQITDWIAAFKQRSPKIERGLLVHGSPGIGKTTSVTLALREAGYHVMEFNASSERRISTIQDDVYPHFVKGSFRGQPLAIVMDEVDGMTGDGGLNLVIQLIKGDLRRFRAGAGKMGRDSAVVRVRNEEGDEGNAPAEPEWYAPLICIANEAYTKKLYELRRACQEVKFAVPGSHSLMQLAGRVLTEQGYTYDPLVPKLIVDNVETADFRHLLVYLEQVFLGGSLGAGTKHITDEQVQALLVSTVDHNYRSIFGTTSAILRNRLSVAQALAAHSFDPAKITSMVHQNYLHHFPEVSRRATNNPATKAAAEADIAEQVWSVAQNYSDADLLAGGLQQAGKFGQGQLTGTLWSFGTSQLMGKQPANTVRPRAPQINRADYRDFGASNSAKQMAKLPYEMRALRPELCLLRYQLEDKRRNRSAAAMDTFLAFADHYRLSFTDMQTIDKLTRFKLEGPQGKFNTGTKAKPLRERMRNSEPVAPVPF